MLLRASVFKNETVSINGIESLNRLAGIASFTTMIVFIAINVSLIRLRKTAPEQNRPFRLPLSVGDIPLIPALGIALCLAFLFQFDRLVYLTGLLSFALSAGIYFSCRYFMSQSSKAP